MASRGRPAGRAFLEIYADDSKLRRALKSSINHVNRFLRDLTRMLRNITVAFGAVAAGFLLLARRGAQAEAIVGRFERAFHGAEDEARKFAETLSKRVGRSVYDIMDAMSGFEEMSISMGFDQSESARISRFLAKNVYDMAEARGLTDEMSKSMIESAMAGRISQRQWGRISAQISEAAIQERMLSMGMTDFNTELDRSQARARAFVSILQEVVQEGDEATRIHGRAASEQTSAMGKINKFQSQFNEKIMKLGEKVLPLFKEISQIVQNMIDFIDSEGLGAGVKKVLDVLKQGIEIIGPVFKAIALDFVDIIINGMREATGILGKAVGAVGSGLSAVSDATSAVLKVDQEHSERGDAPTIFDREFWRMTREDYRANRDTRREQARTGDRTAGAMESAAAQLKDLAIKLARTDPTAKPDEPDEDPNLGKDLKEGARTLQAAIEDQAAVLRESAVQAVGGFFAGNAQVFQAQNFQLSELRSQTRVLNSIDQTLKNSGPLTWTE